MNLLLRNCIVWLIVTGLGLAGLILEYRLWRADFHVPFYYDIGNDNDYYLSKLKAMRDTGWVLTNPWLGAPGIQEEHDFTHADNLPFFIAKLIGGGAPDLGSTVNVFTLVNVLLATWAALYALRRLGVSDPIAVVLSLLFAFQPYMFIRSQMHLPLACTFSVPLIILVAVWLGEMTPVFSTIDDRGKVRLRWPWGQTLPALAAVVLAGSSGAYYAFFGAGCVAIAALTVLLRTRKPARLIDSLIVLVLICGVFALNLAPKIWYDRIHGRNPGGILRGAEDSLVAGLSISSMILPVPYHGLKSLASALLGRTREIPSPKEFYEVYKIYHVQSIGLIAVCGFLLLLLPLFSIRRPRGDFRLVWPLSRLNIGFVLIGGFGYLFATLATPQIRGWSRLNIYIAFVSLAMVGLILEHLRQTRVRTRAAGILFSGALAGMLIFGLIDQMPQALVPSYETAKAEYDRDQAFARAIEAALPETAMVFQLPYIDFPEAFSAHKTSQPFNGYLRFRPYLHSTHIRWSAGAVRNRGVDRWQAQVAEEPVPRMIEDLKAASFRGIYIDRRGYDDGADAAIIDGLKKQLGIEPIADDRGERLFFPLPAPREGTASH
jgi:hypothetical protein